MTDRPAGMLQKMAEGAFLLLTFLLPLKFGTLTGLPEAASYFPPDWVDYLFISWPASGFGIFSGIVLLLTALAFPENLTAYRTPAWHLAAVWCLGVPLLALPGLVNCSGYDFAPIILGNLLGIGCYAASAMLVIAGDQGRRARFGSVLTAAMLLTVWFGLEQYFWGFERARQFLLDQQAQGLQVDEILMLRTFDTRVYGTFSGCNSLAAYLLVILPLGGLVLRQWADRVEPVKVTKYLFCLLGLGAALLVLLLTKSRAAYLALLLTAGILALLFPMKKQWKILLILGIAGVVIAGACYIRYHGRGFDSMISRLDYLRSSWLLWLDHPFFGCGWGEFFYGHMRLKTISHIEAAHDPHNILMTMLQAGPLLMLLTAAAMAEPVWVLWQKLRRYSREKRTLWLPLAGLCALTGFYLHALMDIDLAIPACMATLFGVQIWFLTAPDEMETDAENAPETGHASRWAAVLLLVWGLGCAGASWTLLRGEKALDELNAACGTGMMPGDNQRMAMPAQVENAARNFGKWRPWSSYQYSLPGDYYLKTGDLYLAQQRYDAALRLAPLRPALYWRKATIARMQGDEAAAKQWWEKTLSLFPRNPDYQEMPRLRPIPQKMPSGFGFPGKSINSREK